MGQGLELFGEMLVIETAVQVHGFCGLRAGSGCGMISGMNTITAVLEPDADGTLHLPVPEELKFAKVKVVATLEATNARKSGSHPLLGIWQGDIVYKPGWDEPLEDFKEYRE